MNVMKAQRGQALVEAAIALVPLATLLVAIPCFLAWHDVQRAALRSARDASYMAGWTGMSQDSVIVERAVRAMREMPWRHPADGSPVVTTLRAEDVSHVDAAPPGLAAGLMEFIAKPLGESRDALGGPLALNRAGYHALSVEVNVPAFRGAPAPFEDLPLRLSARSAVLTDAWNSGSPAMVRDRVRPIVPSAALKPLVEPLAVLASPLRLLEPSFDQLCIGLIEPDRVPESRLGERTGRDRGIESAGGCR